MEVKRIPTGDDFGFILRSVETNRIVGRCYCNPGGKMVSDFYGPGSPGILIDCGEERIEYWFYNKEKKKMPTGESIYVDVAIECTAAEFKAKFNIDIEIQKETHINGKRTT